MLQRNTVTRAEWRWAITWIVIALIVSSAPYVIGWARSTPERVYGGFTIFIDDGNSYLAKIIEGAQGAWLFHLPFTSEPHTGSLLYIFHVLLGKVTALTALPPIAVYHLMRLASVTLLLLVLYRFIAMFVATLAARRIAFWLIVFGGGLGWLLILSGQSNWLGSLPLEVVSPEAFTFLMIYAFPHIALARALLLLGFILFWRPEAAWRDALQAGVCWLVMGIIVPIDVPIVYAILCGSWVADSIVHRSIQWLLLRRSIGAGLVAAPMLIYTLVSASLDPIWRAWSAQVTAPSLHPLHYLLAYGLLGLFAVLGLRRSQTSEVKDPKLLGWLVVIPLLIYLPLSAQRRLIETWQIPLGIFAAIGLAYTVLPVLRRARLARGGIALLIVAWCGTYVLLLGTQAIQLLAQQAPFFRDGGEVAAIEWLRQQTTAEDVVLSEFETGNYIPAHTTARAFLGHNQETAKVDQKRELVARFYRASTSDAAREEFLREWPITYIFYGPLEKQWGPIDLAGLPALSLVYDRDGYQIYRVMPDAP